MNIYNPKTFIQKISINISELNMVKNIEDILYLKLKNLENKCNEFGYVKENSIKIKNISSGYLNPTIFVPFIEYKLLCNVEIFKPNVNDIYLVEVISINKIGIMACIKYNYNNKVIIPIKIIISKHNQDINVIKNIKKGDKIYVKILGYKFSKNSNHIDSIANIILNKDIQNIKNLKIIINKLNLLDHECIIEKNKIEKYTNILKFILDKEDITYNELFIYHFIIENKITIHSMDFLDLYNNYIDNFYNTKDSEKQEIHNNIIIEEDLSNIEIDNDTNFETNPEEETNDFEEQNGYINYDEDEKTEDEDTEDEDTEDEEDDDLNEKDKLDDCSEKEKNNLLNI